MLKLPSRLRHGVRPLAPVLAVLLVPASMAQQAAPAPAEPEQTERPVPVTRTDAPREDDTYVLSPFVVSTQRDRGYFAANTLAGSRMNTNIADLGASISVITKQQFEDTASTDLNDIFRYEVNTEGSLTYTPGQQSMRNDGVIDVIAGGTLGNAVVSHTNAQANRVRGLGSPSAAINYFPANPAVPMDAYNMQSVEVSRGPNSMLFGLGSPAGIANVSTAQARLNRTTASVMFRTDQYGSFRSSLNFNQGLIEDRVAIYGAALYDDRRFQRKPSYDKTERFYGAITIKPFEKTTIRANFEKYDNSNRRPNTLTPRDFVTEWNTAGRPYYDATTHTVYSLNTGQPLKMAVNNANSPLAQDLRNFIMNLPGYNPALRGTSATNFNGTDTNFTFYNGLAIFGNAHWGIPAGWAAGTPSPNILFTPGIAETNQGRSAMQIVNGQLMNWFQPTWGYRYLTGFGTTTNPAANPPLFPDPESSIWANPTWADIYARTYTASAGWSAAGNGIFAGAYRYPGVTDKSIYDWTDININSMNYGVAGNKNYNIELEQELPWDLYFSGGWFRQDFKQRTNYTVAQLNVATLFVDTNRYMPDGSVNPMFGKPYVEDFDPDSYYTASLDDHYRAMLAWTPDFTRNSGWTKWLGRHQVLGLWSRDEYMTTTIRQRLHYTAAASDAGRFRYLRNPNNNADGSPTGWNPNTTSLRRAYYLAAPNDPMGVVTQAGGMWDPLSYTGEITVYDYGQSRFIPVQMTTEFIDFDAGTGRAQRIIDSKSAGITSHFWENRLITTLGVREDKYQARLTNTGLPAITERDGTIISPAITNAQKWVNGQFQRDFLFNRWDRWHRVTGTTSTIGGVLRPFQNWENIERNAANGSLWWEFVRDFGFSFNTSDNFNPPLRALRDFYGNDLPKPEGEGKDYGIQFSLFDRKLFARVNWFEATSTNENIDGPNVFARLTNNIDQDNFRNWARTIALINMGFDPTANGFGTGLSAAQENAVQAAAATIWQQPYDYYTTFSRGATRDAKAKGMEAEINYTPVRNWTMKFTFGKQDTKYASVLKEFEPWAQDRMAIWQAARAADYLAPQYQHLATYTTSGGRQVDLTNFWSSYGYHSSLFPENANAFANPEANWNGVVIPQVMVDRDLQGQSVSGQRKYRWSFLTNYTFDQGRLKGFGVGGSVRWEDKAVIGYAGKASGINLYGGVPVLDHADVTRPYYDSANFYTDLWVSYRFALWNDKVRATVRLNVANVFEDGGLRPIAVNYDGSPYSFRIIDPRYFQLTTTFDF